MTDRTYNGWTNRATWLVNVWFNPESRADVESAKYTLEEAEEAIPDYLRDFLCTDEINWDELSEAFDRISE
jgi:capsid portal protein